MKSHALVVSFVLLATVAGAQAPAAHPAPAKSGKTAVVHHAAKHAAQRGSSGMHQKIVSEDPETGAFTAVVTVPSGYKFMPASHPADQWIVVKKGSLAGAQGDKWDAKAMQADKPLMPGDTLTLVAGKNYYAVAKGATEFIVCSSGRNVTTLASVPAAPRRVVHRGQ